MAKPIRATPELSGKDADRFLTKLLKTRRTKPTKRDIQLAEELIKLE